ncbi:DNA-protecting protein DprA [Patescibacteria group bacterium]|nr:DNA-protecting protein DprA [Patescibacteria group bacterium]
METKEMKVMGVKVYCKGDLGLLDEGKVRLAIVGSRKMTDYGRRVIEKQVPVLVQAGVVIVSGFMYGVDQAAHEVCLDCGGETIAVLGWGIDRGLSIEDEKLYEKFIKGKSLMMSEYYGEAMAEQWMFVQRNRIVVGLSAAVLVVEAAVKSGTMTSVRWAKKMNKPVLCVPGLITSKVSEGANGLIKSGEAKMVTGVEDILEVLGLKPGQMKLGGVPHQSVQDDGDLTKVRPLLRMDSRLRGNDVGKMIRPDLLCIL